MGDQEVTDLERKFLLDMNQEELVERMDLEDSHLLDHLQSGDVITNTKAHSIQVNMALSKYDMFLLRKKS